MIYKPGDVILKEKPFAFILNLKEKKKRCDFCLEIVENLKRCSKCKFVYYCSKKCQLNDWKNFHKLTECNIYQLSAQIKNSNSIKTFLDYDSPRLLLRLFLKVKFNPKKWNEEFLSPTNVIRSLKVLCDHEQEVSLHKDRMLLFDEIKDIFIKVEIKFDEKILFNLFCKMFVNGFSILNSLLGEIGSGIYIITSVFNHSCLANAIIVFHGNIIETRAIQNIDTNNQEIFINYLNVIENKQKRHKLLKNNYYFTCTCERCKYENDFFKTTEIDKFKSEINKLYDSKRITDNLLNLKESSILKNYKIETNSIPVYNELMKMKFENLNKINEEQKIEDKKIKKKNDKKIFKEKSMKLEENLLIKQQNIIKGKFVVEDNMNENLNAKQINKSVENIENSSINIESNNFFIQPNDKFIDTNEEKNLDKNEDDWHELKKKRNKKAKKLNKTNISFNQNLINEKKNEKDSQLENKFEKNENQFIPYTAIEEECLSNYNDLNEMFNNLIQNKNWKEAESLSKDILKCYLTFYREDYSVEITLHLIQMLQIKRNILRESFNCADKEVNDLWKTLKKNILVTHGKDHYLYRNDFADICKYLKKTF